MARRSKAKRRRTRRRRPPSELGALGGPQHHLDPDVTVGARALVQPAAIVNYAARIGEQATVGTHAYVDVADATVAPASRVRNRSRFPGRDIDHNPSHERTELNMHLQAHRTYRYALLLDLYCLSACFGPDDPPSNDTASPTTTSGSESGEPLTTGVTSSGEVESSSMPGDTSTAASTTTGDPDSTSTFDDSDSSSTSAEPVAPCASGTFSAGAQALWQRDDVAICPNDDDTILPSSEGQGEALCNTDDGWRLCAASDARERNDDCAPGSVHFVALVATGGNDCVLFDDADPSDPHYKCNDDFAREGFAGSCGGATSATSWGFHERLQTGDAVHGALCCLD